MTILDGKVDMGGGLVIERGITEAQFLSSSVGRAATVFVKNGVHHSYKLQNTGIHGKYFLPLLYFSDNVLTEAHFHPVAANEKSWTAYSSQSEATHQLDNDSWLQKTLGAAPPYAFSWGSIESVLDQKGGMTFVLLRYLEVARQN